jgi:hypothetical protein
MTIEGVGPLTAACLIAELGDPAPFDSPGAIASHNITSDGTFVAPSRARSAFRVRPSVSNYGWLVPASFSLKSGR